MTCKILKLTTPCLQFPIWKRNLSFNLLLELINLFLKQRFLHAVNLGVLLAVSFNILQVTELLLHGLFLVLPLVELLDFNLQFFLLCQTGFEEADLCFEGDELWSMPDEQLVKMATQEIQKLGLARAEKVKMGFVVRVSKAVSRRAAEY